MIIILNLSSLNYSYGQNQKIKEIELTSNILKNQITSFIKDKKNNNSKFKELGYVVVNLDYYNNRANKPELSLIYTIKDQYVSLKENSQFPLFYTYIENKIVLLYIDNYHNYINLSTKSKKRLSNKINKTLGKREKIRGYNSEGEKIIEDKYFYPNESFNIHGGIELKIFANDSISVKPKD